MFLLFDWVSLASNFRLQVEAVIGATSPFSIHCSISHKCATDIDFQDILSHQLEDEIKQKYQAKIGEEKKKYEGEQEKLKQEKLDFKKAKKQENELFQERLESQLKEEKKAIEVKL